MLININIRKRKKTKNFSVFFNEILKEYDILFRFWMNRAFMTNFAWWLILTILCKKCIFTFRPNIVYIGMCLFVFLLWFYAIQTKFINHKPKWAQTNLCATYITLNKQKSHFIFIFFFVSNSAVSLSILCSTAFFANLVIVFHFVLKFHIKTDSSIQFLKVEQFSLLILTQSSYLIFNKRIHFIRQRPPTLIFIGIVHIKFFFSKRKQIYSL